MIGIEDSLISFTTDITYAARATHNPHHVTNLAEAAMPTKHTASYVPSSVTAAAVSRAVLDDEEVSVPHWLVQELGE
jgi:hypothetical protein